MESDELRLLPCYKNYSVEGELAPFHRLHGDMDSEGYWHFLVELCDYGSFGESPKSLAEAVQRLLETDVQVVSGGLVARKGNFTMLPGCCSGLEDWRDWLHVRPNGGSPWLGHDPSPVIETGDELAILHTDVDGDDETTEVTYDQLQLAARKASDELNAFLTAIHRWLKAEGIESADAVAERIDRWFQISQCFDIEGDGEEFVLGT